MTVSTDLPHALAVALNAIGNDAIREDVITACKVSGVTLVNTTKSPQAGYDQLGESHYCLDCGLHWYGASPCRDKDCPFRETGK